MITKRQTFLNILFSLLRVFSIWGENEKSFTNELHTLFNEIGFSPSCVSKTLAQCENSAKDSFRTNMTLHPIILQNNTHLPNELQKHPRNCADLRQNGDKESGIRTVYPFSCCHERPVSVYCDQTTDGGGWTVFQHREALPQRENFFRKWTEYELGFGDLNGEFWLGLRNIHALVSSQLMELRVDLEDFEGKKRWAKYSYFYIADYQDKYRIDLGEYSGNAGDSLIVQNGQKFSTKDQDNDPYDGDCANSFSGAWWYEKCHDSNLNGLPHKGNHTSYADGINWNHFRGHKYSLKTTSLSTRPAF